MKIKITVLETDKKSKKINVAGLPFGAVYQTVGGEILLKGGFGNNYIITDCGGKNAFLENASPGSFTNVAKVYGVISGITVQPIEEN